MSDPVPGSKEHADLLAKKRAAAEAWIEANAQVALVVPCAVAKDLLPGGMGTKEFAPIVDALKLGEPEDVVLCQPNVYVHLRRS